MDSNSENSLAPLATDVNRYYERMVLLYWHELRAFLINRIRNPQDAEDLVQDVFVRAYLALGRYPVAQRQSLKARPWLYKIAWHQYFSYLGRSKAAITTSLEPGELGEENEWEDEQGELPELAYEREEQRQELENCVAMLPSHYRLVVSLYYFSELNYQEIAETLNQPVGTVKSYVHRGIKLLRKTMSVQLSEA